MHDKRQAILTAAQTLLARYGFHGFSMKQLAREAGMAAGTLYLYFQDKETLISELHREIVVDLGREWFAGQDTNKAPRDQYQDCWLKLWDICTRNADRVMCKNQFDNLPPASHRALAENAQVGFQPLYALLRAARERKLLKPLSDEVLLSLSVETCLSLARKQIMGLIDLDEATCRQAAAASWDAIAVNPSDV